MWNPFAWHRRIEAKLDLVAAQQVLILNTFKGDAAKIAEADAKVREQTQKLQAAVAANKPAV